MMHIMYFPGKEPANERGPVTSWPRRIQNDIEGAVICSDIKLVESNCTHTLMHERKNFRFVLRKQKHNFIAEYKTRKNYIY